LGATPTQVFIDGITQLDEPQSIKKPPKAQRIPKPPDFRQEAEEAVKHNGLPPLEMIRSYSDMVVFRHVNAVFLRNDNKIEEVFSASKMGEAGVVVTQRGKITCYGSQVECSLDASGTNVFRHVDLKGGSISRV